MVTTRATRTGKLDAVVTAIRVAARSDPDPHGNHLSVAHRPALNVPYVAQSQRRH
jgi:hypothetical protein